MSFLCFRSLLGAAALLLLASGCFVTSEQPLSDPGHAQPDPGLAGQWQSTMKDQSQKVGRFRFDAHGQGFLEDRTDDGHWKPSSDGTRFFVTRTAKASYLNLPGIDRDGKYAHHPRTLYQFVKYEFSPNRKQLTLWMPKVAVFRQAVTNGALKGQIEKDERPGRRDDSLDGVLLQDSPAAILRFMEARPTKKRFEVLNVLRRID